MNDPFNARTPRGRSASAGVAQQGHPMYRYGLIVLVGLCAGGSAAGGWADSLFEERTRDFGSVPHGPLLTHSFPITNKTKNVVQVANVRVSCGCVSAHAQHTVLQPGEATAIVANMDTSRFHGHKSVTVYVTFSQPQWEEVSLVVSANSRADVSISPSTMAFGKIQRGTSPTSTVNLGFFGNGQWQVEEVRSESNYIKPAIKEVRRSTGEVAYELTASVRSDVPVGKWYTDLWLKTNNPNIPQVRVPLTVEVEPAINVNPKVAELGEVKTGATKESKIIIRGSKPFRITKIDGGDDQLAVTDTTKDAKQVHVLTLALKASKAGDLSWKLRVQTDLPEEGEVAFPATAKVVP